MIPPCVSVPLRETGILPLLSERAGLENRPVPAHDPERMAGEGHALEELRDPGLARLPGDAIGGSNDGALGADGDEGALAIGDVVQRLGRAGLPGRPGMAVRR